MTKEEAETLRPGDVISCACNSKRVLTKVSVYDCTLFWNQEGAGTTEHSYPIDKIDIVKRANQIIDTYDIY